MTPEERRKIGLAAHEASKRGPTAYYFWQFIAKNNLTAFQWEYGNHVKPINVGPFEGQLIRRRVGGSTIRLEVDGEIIAVQSTSWHHYRWIGRKPVIALTKLALYL